MNNLANLVSTNKVIFQGHTGWQVKRNNCVYGRPYRDLGTTTVNVRYQVTNDKEQGKELGTRPKRVMAFK